MSGYLATRDASEADYDAIQQAVMETDRGRWFLGEFARRNRHAETESLVASLSRIERAVVVQREPNELDRFRLDVLEMSRAIARTRAEIAAIKPPETDGRIVEASGELESIVSATEAATSDILAAAENVQEVAWTLREAGADAEACGRLDQHAVAIYTACSFQDLTAQRTRKVTEILGFLEKRVNAMADIWQFAEDESGAAAGRQPDQAAMAQDPAMSQADVDDVLVAEAIEDADFELEMNLPGVRAPETATLAEIAADLDAADLDAAGFDAADFDTLALDAVATAAQPVAAEPFAALALEPAPSPVAAPAMDDARIDDILFDRPLLAPPADVTAQLRVVEAGPSADAVLAKARAGQTLTPDEAATALDALKGMSVEERTKLFS
jgi:chemotaxis protein CheZ